MVAFSFSRLRLLVVGVTLAALHSSTPVVALPTSSSVNLSVAKRGPSGLWEKTCKVSHPPYRQANCDGREYNEDQLRQVIDQCVYLDMESRTLMCNRARRPLREGECLRYQCGDLNNEFEGTLPIIINNCLANIGGNLECFE